MFQPSHKLRLRATVALASYFYHHYYYILLLHATLLSPLPTSHTTSKQKLQQVTATPPFQPHPLTSISEREVDGPVVAHLERGLLLPPLGWPGVSNPESTLISEEEEEFLVTGSSMGVALYVQGLLVMEAKKKDNSS